MIDQEPQIGNSAILDRGSLDEVVTLQAVDALMSNYPGALPAVLELVDNAVDNRIPGQLLNINIAIQKDEINIRNSGGAGLGLEGLKDFFRWGMSGKGSGRIGRYGVGGKGAMGYLGRSMEVTCSEPGSNLEYQVTDVAWEQKIGQDKVEHEWISKPASSESGYFKVRIWHLKRHVNQKFLVDRLSEIYRPILMDNPVTGESRAVRMVVGNNEVKPVGIHYLFENPDLRPIIYPIATPFGPIKVAAGVLAPEVRIKPGFRCYVGGRLISDSEFFGFPTPDKLRQAQRLVGEAYLDVVPVTANKADFDRGSIEWEDVFMRITQALREDWEQRLRELPSEQTIRIEGFERELAKSVRRDLEHIINKERIKRIIEIQEEEAEDERTSKGSRSATPSGRRGIREGEGKAKRRYEQLTVPPIELASLGEYNRQARIILSQGKVVMQINADHPLYQAAKEESDSDLRLYMDTAAADGMARFGTQGEPQDEYHEFHNEILRSIGELRLVRSIRVQERRTSRS